MLKLNNKGFAITGILYTLFILFLLILVSLLGGLKSKQNLLMNSVDSFENKYQLSPVCNTKDTCNNNSVVSSGIIKYSGKYIFRSIDSAIADQTCTAYLKKGTNIINDNITFFPAMCNDYDKEQYELIKVYKFKKENEG